MNSQQHKQPDIDTESWQASQTSETHDCSSNAPAPEPLAHDDRLCTILSVSPVVVYACELEAPHRLTFIAGGVEPQFGYTAVECLADPRFRQDRIHPDDAQYVATEWSRLRESGHHVFEYRFLHKNGAYRTVRDEVRIAKDDAGSFWEVIGSWIDVTPLRQLESDLRASEDRCRALFDDDLAGHFVSSPDGKLLRCNDAFAKMFRFSSVDEAMKCDLRTLYRHPGDRDGFLMELGTHGRLEHHRETMRRRDGTLVSVVENVIASFAPNGALTEIKGYVVDETERALAEEALRTSEERYRDLFENAKDIVFTTDLQMRFTSLNLAGETITGYTRAEALGLRIDQVVPAEFMEMIKARLRDGLDGKTTQPCEAEVITKDGRRIPMEVSSRLISREGRPEGIQGIARDISDRKRLEDQLRQAQRMEAIGRLAGGIANDFNNMLTVILGHGEELRTCFDPSDPRRELAQQICTAAQRAANLMRKLLAFSRHQNLDPRVLDLNSVVMGLGEKLRGLLGEQVELAIIPAANLHRISADPGQIEQAIVNLVVNAREAMPRGGRLTIETANAELDARYVLRHRGDRSGSYVRLTISDTGVGMDGETLSRLFEPFFTTKDGGRGAGLGLSTVYGIVKQSGAYISVNSQVGRGSVFDLYFPRVDGAVDADNARTQVTRPASGTKTILIVEEERAVLEQARRVLALSGYTVLAARTAQEARRLSDSHHGPIDLLIAGMLISGDMNGPALAERFTSERPYLKLLYISGRRNSTVVQPGIRTQAVPILSKPFTSDELTAKVTELLNGS